MKWGLAGFLLLGIVLFAAGCDKAANEEASHPGQYNREMAVAAMQKGGCTACHVIRGCRAPRARLDLT